MAQFLLHPPTPAPSPDEPGCSCSWWVGQSPSPAKPAQLPGIWAKWSRCPVRGPRGGKRRCCLERFRGGDPRGPLTSPSPTVGAACQGLLSCWCRNTPGPPVGQGSRRLCVMLGGVHAECLSWRVPACLSVYRAGGVYLCWLWVIMCLDVGLVWVLHG